MTDLSAILENFDSALAIGTADEAPDQSTSETIEAARLAGFDNGYRSGWDDAAATNAKEQTAIGSDLARNLRDLSFTYNEAHFAAVASMTALLEEMVSKVLPQIIQETLGVHIHSTLKNLAATHGACPTEIRVSHGNATAVETLIHEDFGFEIHVRADGNIGPGQAEIAFGQVEQTIDLDGLLAEIVKSVDAMRNEREKGNQNESHG